ncbi:MAG: HD domain-containing protein [Cytophagales bacterium]|nr:MAG: HD domain-containing protein [Cytophagales bacterium]
MLSNKKKIFNDPIYGFITIPSPFIFDIIEHPYFQRLRRIKQLGLADFTYPGALHTRFHHALGAMHLMGMAIENLRSKGHFISEQEAEAAQIAILLHDIGHGPFSHTLEFTILKNTNHEQLTLLILKKLNNFFGNRLSLAIEIFENRYPRKFLHQLISSQLDIDRLDYLQRDCFFTGVSEGTIGADRIIKMLEIVNDQIVVEEKAIYSIENFLSARRLMYWQVYLHKTVLSAETMVIQIIKRAQFLVQQGQQITATDALSFFLNKTIQVEDSVFDNDMLEQFLSLDDYDVWAAIKFWTKSDDKVLSYLCQSILNRKLFKVEISPIPFEKTYLQSKIEELKNNNQKNEYLEELVVTGEISNAAYNTNNHQINILKRNGDIMEIAEASDLANIQALNRIVKKYYLCYPKTIIS